MPLRKRGAVVAAALGTSVPDGSAAVEDGAGDHRSVDAVEASYLAPSPRSSVVLRPANESESLVAGGARDRHK